MLKKANCKGIEILKKKGKILSFKKVDTKKKVKGIMSSYFIVEENVIVRGGYNCFSNKTLIMAIDAVKNKFRGKNGVGFLLNFTFFIIYT